MGAYRVGGSIDEAWEYYMPDPEIDEIVHGRRDSADLFREVDPRAWSRRQAVGFRFGRSAGALRWMPCRLARPRPCRVSAVPDNLVCAGCGRLFRPERSSVRYCSASCVPHAGAERLLPDAACAACGVTFRPAVAIQRYCSQACFGLSRRAAAAASGCPVCGGDVGASRSNNGRPKKYCSRRCMRAAVCRAHRAAKAGVPA